MRGPDAECRWCGSAPGQCEPMCLGGQTVKGPWDIEGGRQGRDDGMARAEFGAGPHWVKAAETIVLRLAGQRENFTTDDVWEAGLPRPREARALGAVMQRMARLDVIEATGRVVPSRWRACHTRPVMVWRSLVYRKAEAG